MNILHKPKVSIIITCYNYGEYLDAAIYSCLKSTCKDIEILVVNDGSTDPYTLKVLNRIRHPKIHIINQANKGLPAARNAGIKQASSEYILPVDADDLISSTLIEKELSILERKTEISVVTHWTRAFGTENWVWRPQPFNIKTLLQENIVCVTSLFRKKAWEDVCGYNEQMNEGYEDWDFWISLAENNCLFYTIPEVLFFYRRHGKTMVHDSDRKREYLINKIKKNHKDLYEKYGLY
ncbi:glycosyltransferase family 2 protein [Clostridium sp. SYSU_GA19001]|uniref:glycosyltransferase family 2 protein n=1 Tax=Clostridium caldaquaticum TaxID=2940653 RepID=UPI00207710B2|nr:glycosyltransferase family A protein [Clostridium caldaquaticum]MCM8711962.1 glycosyltransferase family 2 protein [Clostridium caldaquaticum]